MPGDQADFNEYEYDTEEKIISEDLWSDGTTDVFTIQQDTGRLMTLPSVIRTAIH